MTYATPTPSDLGTYLNDSTVNSDRAELLISQAETLAGSVVSPLPTGADVVVLRVAARGYVTITSARQAQAAAANMPFGAMAGGGGDISLSQRDIADLRRLAGGGGAFTVDMLPAGYTLPFVGFATADFDTIPSS